MCGAAAALAVISGMIYPAPAHAQDAKCGDLSICLWDGISLTGIKLIEYDATPNGDVDIPNDRANSGWNSFHESRWCLVDDEVFDLTIASIGPSEKVLSFEGANNDADWMYMRLASDECD